MKIIFGALFEEHSETDLLQRLVLEVREDTVTVSLRADAKIREIAKKPSTVKFCCNRSEICSNPRRDSLDWQKWKILLVLCLIVGTQL